VADDVPTRWRELFAWTVREAVTNVLRHSGATCCEVRLGPDAVEVVDDGVGGGAVGSGTGLAGLARRAEDASARLVVGDRPDGPGSWVWLEVPPERGAVVPVARRLGASAPA
jgi:two-component system sensor histidine kinase DesK